MRMQNKLIWLSLAIIVILVYSWYSFSTTDNVTNDVNEDRSSNKILSRLSKGIDWTSIEKKPKASDLHDKWVVVTTINAPTEDVKKLAKMDGWKVVVVGDTKTPSTWSHPNCVFLSVEDQNKLGYRIVDLLPYKSYARKNIGYLYAIQHGAKQIYDTDDDNHPSSGQISFYQNDSGDFLVYNTKAASVNPYSHFGQSTIWPRGYPLENISNPTQHFFDKCQDVQTSIQQGVVDGDPDIDAIFRLTRKDKGVRLDVKFDDKAPPVLLPPGTMAPFNSQNTFFLYKGLWATVLPITTAFRVCDIWRGYFAQRLLWEIGGYLSFFPPNAVQVRSAHDYLLDFIDEKDLYHDAGRLVKFLANWKSDKKDFFNRVMELSVAMVENKFWGVKDALLTEAWLSDLASVGYEMPKLEPTPKKCSKVLEKKLVFNQKEQPSSYLRKGSQLVDILK